MVTYWYYRVRYFESVCVPKIPEDYQAAVRAKLRANGYNDCGKPY